MSSSVAGTPEYDERLGVPLRWWALATMFLASVLLAFLVALPVGVALGSVGLMALGAVALFLGYGAARVTVCDGELVVGSARIPVRYLADPTPLDSAETKRAIGVEANALAYLVIRPYLKRAVRIRVTDPADPTPYWLVSTRHPRQLSAALARAIETASR